MEPSRREDETHNDRLERIAEYRRVITERLGIDTDKDPDPWIDLPDVALLAGLSESTPTQWRQRTLDGSIRFPFPEPEPDTIGSRYPDKPLWPALSVVIPYLEVSGNWPPGAGARPMTRGKRKIENPSAKAGDRVTLVQLKNEYPELAEKVAAAQLDDGKARRVGQWSYRLKNPPAAA